MVFGEDGVTRGKGRVKAPPFASDIGEMSKGAAMIANVPHFSSESQ